MATSLGATSSTSGSTTAVRISKTTTRSTLSRSVVTVRASRRSRLGSSVNKKSCISPRKRWFSLMRLIPPSWTSRSRSMKRRRTSCWVSLQRYPCGAIIPNTARWPDWTSPSISRQSPIRPSTRYQWRLTVSPNSSLKLFSRTQQRSSTARSRRYPILCELEHVAPSST